MSEASDGKNIRFHSENTKASSTHIITIAVPNASINVPTEDGHTITDKSVSFLPLQAQASHLSVQSISMRDDNNTLLEQNRKTSIAVLQNKIEEYHGDGNVGDRRKTINQMIKSWTLPSNNSANLKIFGGYRAVIEEQSRCRQTTCVIHPYSSLRYKWDLLVMLLLAINMVILPLNIAFFKTTKGWIVFELTMFVLFTIDIILNFRTGFKERSHGYKVTIILCPRAIMRRYVKSWFFVDLISSLPFDLITLVIAGNNIGDLNSSYVVKGASQALKFLRMTKLLSLIKLLRMTRFVRIVDKYEDFYRLTASIVRYVKLILCMLMVAHWNGCLAFLVPLLQEFPETCWVSLNRLQDAHWSHQYGWALFKALSHMLCIGYGRFIPQLLSEAVITIFSMITGATFYALFIAHSMAYIQQNDSARRQYLEKFKQIEEYMCYRNLPAVTRERISDYYEHKYTQRRLFNETEILAEISPTLRDDIVNHNCRDLIESVPFLKEGGPDFITLLISQLKFDVYLPGDAIIKEGTFGYEMYFIRHGVVDILSEGQHVSTLTEGEYFGEITMLTNARRVASVTAATVCNIFVLHKDNLYRALDEFPEMRILLEHVALDRLMKLRHKFPGREHNNTDTATYQLEGSVEKSYLSEDHYESNVSNQNSDHERNESESDTFNTNLPPKHFSNKITPVIEVSCESHHDVLETTISAKEVVSKKLPPKCLNSRDEVLKRTHVRTQAKRRHSEFPNEALMTPNHDKQQRSVSLNLNSRGKVDICDCPMCQRNIFT